MSSAVDVAIIGGGLSGLAAAYEILSTDDTVSVVVLEASDRVGGRAYADADGVDLGAGYIGPTQDRVMRLVDVLGLELYKVHTLGKTVQFAGGRASRYDGTIPPMSPLGLLDVNSAMVELDRIAATVDVQRPHLTPGAAALDGTTLAQFVARQCWTAGARKMLGTAVRALLCVEPHEVSVLGFAWYNASSGGIKRLLETADGLQDSKVVGGTGTIGPQLAKRLPAGWVRLNAPVRLVDMTKAGVVVVHGDGFAVTAKAVIMAIPPVQQLRLQFSPPLPPNRTQALQHWPMGHIIKTCTYYDTAFWRERGLNGAAVADEGISVVTYDDSKPDGSRPCIMGFVLSGEAARWSARTPGERQAALARHYAAVFGTDAALSPVGYKEKNWAAEPYVGGCYVGVPAPGALTKFPGEVSKCAIAENVFVAGTEAARVSVGYMDGAVEAGERSARNALVHLGRLPRAMFEAVSRPAPSPQLPFVPMDITYAERHLVPSVPQALCIAVTAAAAVAVAWFSPGNFTVFAAGATTVAATALAAQRMTR
jgi:monoamine oxidase